MPQGHPHFVWKDLFKGENAGKSDLIEILKETFIFSTLSRRELSYLSKVVYERVYQPDEAIFNQNDRGFGMYVIARGQVVIKTRSREGEMLVTTLAKGSFFGELSLV